jgi:hypothetical protein
LLLRDAAFNVARLLDLLERVVDGIVQLAAA